MGSATAWASPAGRMCGAGTPSGWHRRPPRFDPASRPKNGRANPTLEVGATALYPRQGPAGEMLAAPGVDGRGAALAGGDRLEPRGGVGELVPGLGQIHAGQGKDRVPEGEGLPFVFALAAAAKVADALAQAFLVPV